jgi:hypothetical protein
MTAVVAPVWNFSDYEKFLPPGGLIYNYVWYAVQGTDAPPEYHIMSALALTSTAVAPQMDLVFRNVIHPLHLYQLIVGDSSASRKTSSIKRALRMASPVFDRVSNGGARLFFPSTSSPEGIVDELAKEANRLIILYEWTDLHRLLAAKWWGHQSEMWNTLYDAPETMSRVKAGGKQVRIERPRVSILGASTRELVNSAVGMLDWHAGKMARYLICCAKRPDDKEMEADQDVISLVRQLQDELNFLIGPLTLPTYGMLSDEAWELVRKWDKDPAWQDLQRSASAHIAPSFARAKEHVLRVATLYEASLRTPDSVGDLVVQPDSMLPAILFVEHCMRSLVDNFGLVIERTASPLDRVRAALKNAGQAGMARSMLVRKTHLTARNLDEALLAIRVAEQLCEKDVVTGGRTGRWYWLVDE